MERVIRRWRAARIKKVIVGDLTDAFGGKRAWALADNGAYRVKKRFPRFVPIKTVLLSRYVASCFSLCRFDLQKLADRSQSTFKLKFFTPFYRLTFIVCQSLRS